MAFIKAELLNGSTIRFMPREKIGQGVEKEFYLTEDESMVIGFYKDQKSESDPERIKRLSSIIDKYNPDRDTASEALWANHFCWPKEIVVKPRIGVLAPKFPAKYYFSDGKGEKKLKWFSNDRLTRRLKKSERGDLLNRLKLCRHLAEAVNRMHSAGLAHSDLSGNNILADPSTGSCIIIDIDSLVVKGVFPPKVLGTQGYIAPEVLATVELRLNHPRKCMPSIKTDLHSLAVLIYEMLLLRHPLDGNKVFSEDTQEDNALRYGKAALFIEDPDDDSNRPSNLKIVFQSLGPYLTPLFLRAFTSGLKKPDRRPTALQWDEALTRTLETLYPCQGKDCDQRQFVCQPSGSAVCPFCGWQAPHLIPLMRMFRQRLPGQYISERQYLTLWPDRKLYKWHTRTDVTVFADNSAQNDKKGWFILKDNTWFFKNESDKRMICSSGEHIHPGYEIELCEQKFILLSDSPQGRLAAFEFLG